MKKTAPFFYTLFITAILTLSLPLQQAQAQMFSVGDPEPTGTQQMLGAYTTITAGWEFAQFEYTGDLLSDTERLDFNDSVFRLALETPGLDLSIGFGGALTGMNDNSYVNVTGRIFSEFSIFRRENLRINVPLQIITDLKRVQQNRTDIDFQQSSFVFGSGLSTHIRLGSALDLSIGAKPSYGFSFSQGNLFGGSLFRADGSTRLYFRNLIGERTFTLGYNFNFRSYDIDGDRDDYRYTGHTIILGIAL